MKKLSRLKMILPELSSLSFGGWALGGEYWGEQNHNDSVRAIHRALYMGINHFDTAPVYGKGQSEQILGQQLKKNRHNVFLSTKAFYTHPQRMKLSLEASLRRMVTDYIDIFYIHWPLSGEDMRPGMEMLEKLRHEGKIRAIGVSNFSVDQMKSIEESGQIDVFQGGFNLFWPRLEKEVLPFLADRNIGFIPYGVLAQGILTESGLEHLDKKHKGHRNKMILYDQKLESTLRLWLKNLLFQSNLWGIPLEQAVTHFILNHTSADTVLLGVRNRQQAEINFMPLKKDIPASFNSLLRSIIKEAGSLLPDVPNLFNHNC